MSSEWVQTAFVGGLHVLCPFHLCKDLRTARACFKILLNIMAMVFRPCREESWDRDVNGLIRSICLVRMRDDYRFHIIFCGLFYRRCRRTYGPSTTHRMAKNARATPINVLQ